MAVTTDDRTGSTHHHVFFLSFFSSSFLFSPLQKEKDSFSGRPKPCTSSSSVDTTLTSSATSSAPSTLQQQHRDFYTRRTLSQFIITLQTSMDLTNRNKKKKAQVFMTPPATPTKILPVSWNTHLHYITGQCRILRDVNQICCRQTLGSLRTSFVAVRWSRVRGWYARPGARRPCHAKRMKRT